MTTVHAASPLVRPKIVPAFTVQKIGGTHEVMIYEMVRISDRKDKNGNYKYKLEGKKQTKENGWLVTFPAGHSVHIADYAELEAHGFTRTETPLIDDEGDAIGSVPNQVQKPAGKGVTINA